LTPLGSRRETDLLENGHDSVLAFGLELGILQAVVENGKIGILTLVVLNETGANLVLGRETLELAVGNGTHQGGLSSTVSTTETVTVTLEQTEVGVREQEHTTVTKREGSVDNLDLAILKRWGSTELALILGDVELVDSLSDGSGLALLHKGSHVGCNVAGDAHKLAVGCILSNHGGKVNLGQGPNVGIASHLEKTAICFCLLFQDLENLFRDSAVGLRVVAASLLAHGLLDNLESSVGNLTDLGKRGSVADSLGTGEKLGEESSGLDRVVDKLGQVLDDNDGLTSNFLRSAGAVERALEEGSEDGENGGGDDGHESSLRESVNGLLQTCSGGVFHRLDQERKTGLDIVVLEESSEGVHGLDGSLCDFGLEVVHATFDDRNQILELAAHGFTENVLGLFGLEALHAHLCVVSHAANQLVGDNGTLPLGIALAEVFDEDGQETVDLGLGTELLVESVDGVLGSIANAGGLVGDGVESHGQEVIVLEEEDDFAQALLAGESFKDGAESEHSTFAAADVLLVCGGLLDFLQNVVVVEAAEAD